MSAEAFRLFIGAFLEMDDMGVVRNSDGTVTYIFETTGLSPLLCKLKAKIMTTIQPPIKRVINVRLERLQKGLLSQRYRVYITTVPLEERSQ